MSVKIWGADPQPGPRMLEMMEMETAKGSATEEEKENPKMWVTAGILVGCILLFIFSGWPLGTVAMIGALTCVITGHLNERSMVHIKNGDYGLYRNCRFSMSEFVKEEGKLEKAFSLLTEVIRYDLSGLSNGFDKKFMDIYADGYFPYKGSIVTMAPGITSRVVDYKETKGFSDDELKNKLLEYMSEIRLPFSLFTAAECADIVLMEIHKDEEGLERLYKKAEKRFKKEYVIK